MTKDRFHIEDIEIGKLNPATYNPRKDLKPGDKEYEDIRRSLDEFGLVDPLVVNSDMTVIGGHQRLKVLKEVGFKRVPCSIVNLDKKREKALNIALNKISGEWDFLKLKEIIEEIDTEDFDIEITGWGHEELDEIFGAKEEAPRPEVEFSEELLLEHNYVVLYFDNPLDWEVACEKFDLKKVKERTKVKNPTVGIGRVLKGSDWLDRIV